MSEEDVWFESISWDNFFNSYNTPCCHSTGVLGHCPLFTCGKYGRLQRQVVVRWLLCNKYRPLRTSFSHLSSESCHSILPCRPCRRSIWWAFHLHQHTITPQEKSAISGPVRPPRRRRILHLVCGGCDLHGPRPRRARSGRAIQTVPRPPRSGH